MAKAIFVLAFLLNIVWEVGQGSFYSSYRDIPLALRLMFCSLAAIMDAVFITGTYYTGRFILHDPRWIYYLRASGYIVILLVGAIAAVISERIALALGWWGYTPSMPQLSFLEVGLLPVAQLSALSLATFLLARCIFKSA
jgi:hypothetical protein